jgi:acyl carrier protein
MQNIEQILSFIKEDVIIGDLEVVDCLSEIDDNDQLIDGGLGLDSIEVLEFVASIEKKYGLKFKDYSGEVLKEKMASLNALSTFIFEEVQKH